MQPLVASWCFSDDAQQCELQDLYGKTLPWPLNYIIPYTQAVTVARQFKGQDTAKVCQCSAGDGTTHLHKHSSTAASMPPSRAIPVCCVGGLCEQPRRSAAELHLGDGPSHVRHADDTRATQRCLEEHTTLHIRHAVYSARLHVAARCR
jgi:hypothetical protein